MRPFQLFLPATSANLGPGFDCLAVALDFGLHVKASPAVEYSLAATGRDAEFCALVPDNMILTTYQATLRAAGRQPTPLHLQIENQIPIGKGCGSSAAARLAGVALAARFGGLAWDAQRVFAEAAIHEGHPDNVAACWWGGLVAAGSGGRWLRAAPANKPWPLLVVVPPQPLATEQARQVLPEDYVRADAVSNLQNVALFLLAWEQGRSDLLQSALADRWHQPYRSALCPLLPALQPLAGQAGIIGCVLSGAGPSVLLILQPGRDHAEAQRVVRDTLRQLGLGAEMVSAEVHPRGPGGAWE